MSLMIKKMVQFKSMFFWQNDTNIFSRSRVSGASSQKSYKCYYILFCHVFVDFRYKICVFIIFISFFNEVSNFRNSVYTNKKRELMVSNCQWNCMLSTKVNWNFYDIVKIQLIMINNVDIFPIYRNGELFLI